MSGMNIEKLLASARVMRAVTSLDRREFEQLIFPFEGGAHAVIVLPLISALHPADPSNSFSSGFRRRK